MTLLAVVAVSTAPAFGPGIAAASNHGTATIEVTDASTTKTNSSGTYAAPFSVVSGVEFQVEFTAENTGSRNGTEQVAVTANGEQVSQIDVTVDGNQQTSETVPVALDDTGKYDIAVDGVSAGTVTVVEPANITVTETTVDRATVTRGESIEVTHTLENTGGKNGDLTVTPILENTDTETSQMVNELVIEVGAGETETSSWTLDTGALDELPAGEYELRPGGSSNPTITIEESTRFTVDYSQLSDESTVTGESVELTVRMANPRSGDGTATEDVILQADGSEIATRTVEIENGDTETLEFSPTFDSEGTYDLMINGAPVGTVEVADEGSIQIRDARLFDTQVNTDTDTGGYGTREPELWVTVENTGGQDGTITLPIEVGGTRVGGRSVAVPAGETVNETLLYRLEGAVDEGDHEVTVGGVTAGTLTVGQPDIQITDARWNRTAVTRGGAAELTVTARNDGTVTAGQEFWIETENKAVDAVSFDLAPDESGTDTYVHTFEESGTSQFTVGNETQTVTVREPAAFDTAAVELNRTSVRTGEPTEVTATVVNDGDETGTSPVRLQTNDDIVDTTNVTLPGGQQTEVTFIYVFESGGVYDVAVNGNSGGNVSVTQPATFEVRDARLSNSSAETGESVDVTGTVANIGTESGNYTAALTENNQTLKSKTIGPIAGGETATVTFSISFDNEGNRSLSIGNATTETLAVEAESSSDGGGGGGGGGGGFSLDDESDDTDDGGGAEAPAISQSQLDNGVSVRVTADAANSTVSQSLNRSGPSETAPAFTLSKLSLNVTNESEGFNATMLGPHATPNGMAAVQEDGVRGYVTITSGANASVISRAKYTLRLNESALPANGSMDAVRVFQYHNESWRQLSSTATATNGSIQATSPTLSTIAVVSPVANASTQTTVGSSNTNMTTSTPAELTITDASVTADWVRAGFNTSVRATVGNPTEETVEQTLTVTVDGDPVAARTVRLNAGEESTVTMEFEAADGVVAVNGVSAGDLRVGSNQAQSATESGTDKTGKSGGGAEPAAETVAASGPGFTVQLVALVLALIAGLVRVRQKV
ncbi:cell surface glycoprotein [Haloarcula sp. CBA1130]|nr:cell surface glycoprotein [Haloarcula sp. CBA1129]KAA9402501.1 cell surface glycoprotein [Haloarcula sp. CBA1130]